MEDAMWHWLAYWTGLTNPAGPVYAFWSGFAGDIPLLGAVLVLWRRHCCHAQGCHRLGIHHVPGTIYTTCRRHHPAHEGTKKPTPEQITEAHEAATEDR
jgi:hypothetical protein